MKLNPILNKEMKVGARTIKYSLLIMLYNVILAFIGIVVIIGVNSDYANNGQISVEPLTAIFPVAGYIQFFLVCIMVPIITAASIAGERERQTLDIMLTTAMSTKEILKGKITSSVGLVMIFVITSIPLLSLSFIYGGFSWYQLILLLGVLLLHCVLIASIGVFCSVLVKKTVAAVVLAFVFEVAVMVIPFIVYAILMVIGIKTQNKGILNITYDPMSGNNFCQFSTFVLVLDPGVAFVDYMQWATGGRRISDMLLDASTLNWYKNIMKYGLIPINAIVELLTAFLFYRSASKILNPIHKFQKRKKKEVRNAYEPNEIKNPDISKEEQE